MTLHNYIRKRLHDDIAFVESQPKNFVPDDILPDAVIFYLMLMHTQEAMKTVVLVGWILYVMELQIV
jgi:hypothetical protein